MTVSQNYQEALLLLEQLESQVESHGFRRELSRSEELVKTLTLDPEEQVQLSAHIEGLKAKQESWKAEHSQALKQELETAFAQIEAALVVPEQAISEIWESACQQLDGARKDLETLQNKLKSEGRNLTKADQDLCWQQFKSLRKTQKKNRQNLSSALVTEAESHLREAETIVKSEPSLRLARENFQVKQRLVNQMPLWREQRQRFHKHFNALWNELQARSKSLREDRQQRQEDGLQKLEEALEQSQQWLARKEEDFNTNQDRYTQAHWHEVDPIEKQLERSRKDLAQAQRKVRELEYKIADARKRMPVAKAVVSETSAPDAESAEMDANPETSAADAAVVSAEDKPLAESAPKQKPKAVDKPVNEQASVEIPEPPPSAAHQALANLRKQLAGESEAVGEQALEQADESLAPKV